MFVKLESQQKKENDYDVTTNLPSQPAPSTRIARAEPLKAEDSVPGTLRKNENGNQMAESREPHFALTPEPTKGVSLDRFKAVMGLDKPVELTPEQDALERRSRPSSPMTKEQWKEYLHKTATDWTGKRLH